jgi:hypothetical protein
MCFLFNFDLLYSIKIFLKRGCSRGLTLHHLSRAPAWAASLLLVGRVVFLFPASLADKQGVAARIPTADEFFAFWILPVALRAYFEIVHAMFLSKRAKKIPVPWA